MSDNPMYNKIMNYLAGENTGNLILKASEKKGAIAALTSLFAGDERAAMFFSSAKFIVVPDEYEPLNHYCDNCEWEGDRQELFSVKINHVNLNTREKYIYTDVCPRCGSDELYDQIDVDYDEYTPRRLR